ncbi:unnamed protein product [Prunus armeniaca]|uniref:Pentatricopeptide repeat-containing protein n=1 Tax=Prunus armeniaca TaxID=36596 RepID=A0A6J5U5A9_PRUAR|nr:unnamed protein product [Prunus armeniaca]
MISVTHQGREKQFAAEEISSMILAKMLEKNIELSTKVMRYFSSAVFKTNVVNLAQTISEAATCDQAIEIQIQSSRFSSVLNTMLGTNEEGTRFSNAFDEANANTFYRYVDISWKIRRTLTHLGARPPPRFVFLLLLTLKKTYVYNVMIRAYACTKISVADETLSSFGWLLLYKQMLCDGISPNCLNFPFLVKECTSRVDGCTGRSFHAQVVKYDVFVQNSLIGMYSACGFLNSARTLFDEMLERDVVLWNSMIKGYLRSGNHDGALNLFGKMNERDIITWNSMKCSSNNCLCPCSLCSSWCN